MTHGPQNLRPDPAAVAPRAAQSGLPPSHFRVVKTTGQVTDPAPRTFFGVPSVGDLDAFRRPGGLPRRPLRRRHAGAGNPDRPAGRPCGSPRGDSGAVLLSAVGRCRERRGGRRGLVRRRGRSRLPGRRDDGGRGRRCDPGLGHGGKLRADHGRRAADRRSRRADGRNRRRSLDQLPAGAGNGAIRRVRRGPRRRPHRFPRRAGRRTAHRREPATAAGRAPVRGQRERARGS